jgi:uncharacterized membrane protein YgaE (UPF0421/DUF939 family)
LTTLTDPRFLALKAGLATGLALVAGQVLGNPDVVTTAFVAVLCCSPAVLLGGRICLEQLVGSAIGGGLGSLAVMLKVRAELGVPVAVALAVLLTSALGMVRAVVVAAFTALFVQVVAFGTPGETLILRLQAVLIAGGSALVINFLISSLFYRHLFAKRFAKLESNLAGFLRLKIRPAGPLFAQMSQLSEELAQARLELRLWGRRRTLAHLDQAAERLAALRELLHHAVHLEYQVDDAQREAFLKALVRAESQPPALDHRGEQTGKRLLELRASISAKTGAFLDPGAHS